MNFFTFIFDYIQKFNSLIIRSINKLFAIPTEASRQTQWIGKWMMTVVIVLVIIAELISMITSLKNKTRLNTVIIIIISLILNLISLQFCLLTISEQLHFLWFVFYFVLKWIIVATISHVFRQKYDCKRRK